MASALHRVDTTELSHLLHHAKWMHICEVMSVHSFQLWNCSVLMTFGIWGSTVNIVSKTSVCFVTDLDFKDFHAHCRHNSKNWFLELLITWSLLSLLFSGYWGALSQEVKWLGHEADHSPPSSAKVKDVMNYTSIPPYVFMAWCLVKYRIHLYGMGIIQYSKIWAH